MAADLRTPFYEAGFAILAADGYAGLKQAPLCRSMGVTTGAFYHSFTSWKDFTDRLLEHWLLERTTRLVDLAQGVTDPVARLRALQAMTTELPHRAEAAIRVWSAIDPDVARVQTTVDQARHRVVLEALLALIGDREEAERHTRAAMFLLIGFEQEGDPEPSHLEWSLSLVLDSAARSRGVDGQG